METGAPLISVCAQKVAAPRDYSLGAGLSIQFAVFGNALLVGQYLAYPMKYRMMTVRT